MPEPKKPVHKEMLINVLQPEECRIAIVENGQLEELYVERTSQESYVGNIYKGRIVNIEPSIQAAFVDFGVGRNGFLHVSDVDPQYYRNKQPGRGDTIFDLLQLPEPPEQDEVDWDAMEDELEEEARQPSEDEGELEEPYTADEPESADAFESEGAPAQGEFVDENRLPGVVAEGGYPLAEYSVQSQRPQHEIREGDFGPSEFRQDEYRPDAGREAGHREGGQREGGYRDRGYREGPERRGRHPERDDRGRGRRGRGGRGRGPRRHDERYERPALPADDEMIPEQAIAPGELPPEISFTDEGEAPEVQALPPDFGAPAEWEPTPRRPRPAARERTMPAAEQHLAPPRQTAPAEPASAEPASAKPAVQYIEPPKPDFSAFGSSVFGDEAPAAAPAMAPPRAESSAAAPSYPDITPPPPPVLPEARPRQAGFGASVLGPAIDAESESTWEAEPPRAAAETARESYAAREALDFGPPELETPPGMPAAFADTDAEELEAVGEAPAGEYLPSEAEAPEYEAGMEREGPETGEEYGPTDTGPPREGDYYAPEGPRTEFDRGPYRERRGGYREGRGPRDRRGGPRNERRGERRGGHGGDRRGGPRGDRRGFGRGPRYSDRVSVYQKPPIQEIFHRGQEVLVQVIKEGLGTKGPTLSTYISIPGRYLVLMPGLHRIGVSRKIIDDNQRRRLRHILQELRPPPGLGFIIRTAGLDRTKKELLRDLHYLTRLWRVIVKRLRRVKAPDLIYEESDMITRTIRDVFTSEIQAIRVDEPGAYEHAQEFMNFVMPRYADRLTLDSGAEPLFHRYGLEKEIAKIQQKRLPLPGGGSLIIEQTEALVAIDVNSGNTRVENDAEETAFRVNLAAAREVARQLRLRDLGGVIIIDFIDMRDERHRRQIEQALRDALRRDRARTKPLRMSQFGIIEMTRQRIRPSLKRSSFQDCPACSGTGQVKTAESMSIEVMRLLEVTVHRPNVSRIHLRVADAVAQFLLNRKRRELAELEAKANQQITIFGSIQAPPEALEVICYDAAGGEIRLPGPEAAPPRGRGGRYER